MTENQKTKIWATACYLPPLFVFLLYFQRKNPLVFFHAKQALGTWAVFGLGYVTALLPGQFFAIAKWPVSLTLGAFFAILLAGGIIAAAKGENRPLPLIGEYTDGIPVFQKLQAR